MGKTLRHFGGDILNVRGNYAYIITHHPYLGRCYSYLVLAYCHVTLGRRHCDPEVPYYPAESLLFFLDAWFVCFVLLLVLRFPAIVACLGTCSSYLSTWLPFFFSGCIMQLMEETDNRDSG